MLVIFDFDGVLLDDIRFKRDYIKLFVQRGISAGDYWETYAESKKKEFGTYVPFRHFSLLKKRYPDFNLVGLREDVQKFIKNSKKYVYADARQFLLYLEKRGIERVLISTGPKFQKEKIRSSGLFSYFKKIAITERSSKVKTLRSVLGVESGRVMFIDDKPEIVDEIKKVYPRLFVVQMRRTEILKRSYRSDAIAYNFADIRRTISALELHEQTQ